MSQHLNPNQLGLAFGGFLGLWHLAWSVLVALGLAQPFIDLVFRLHMIQPPYTVMPFSLAMTVGLIVLTFVLGYVMGYALGWIWNMVQKKA
jgi:hypothetical protein